MYIRTPDKGKKMTDYLSRTDLLFVEVPNESDRPSGVVKEAGKGRRGTKEIIGGPMYCLHKLVKLCFGHRRVAGGTGRIAAVPDDRRRHPAGFRRYRMFVGGTGLFSAAPRFAGRYRTSCGGTS